MTKALYITAAPVGAVPKSLNLGDPVFIHGYLLDLIDAKERVSIVTTLENEGWEPVDEGGIALHSGFASTIDDAAVRSAGTASELERDGWYRVSGQWHAPWASEPHDVKPVLARSLLQRIASVGLVRQIVLQLTTFGWTVTAEGDLSWPHGSVRSYLPPGLVQQIRAADATVLDVLRSEGWTPCGAGYWQPGKGRSVDLPLTPEAIVADAHQSLVEGAAIVHLHTRSTADRGQLHIPGLGTAITTGAQRNQIVTEDFERIITTLRALEPAAILNVSTSARGDRSASESPLRRAHLKRYGPAQAHADIASFSPGPVVFQSGGGYDNPHGFLVQQLDQFARTGVRPEIEVFNHTIVENATSIYRDVLVEHGEPVLFMLVAGVDQHRRDAVSGELDDDSLIPVGTRKQIAALLQRDDVESTLAAARIAADALRPTVGQLREHFPSSKISILLPGAFHAILVDVALALSLDGIRVGLEDALNVFDSRVPGGVRRAQGTSDQVRALKLDLERRGIATLSAEALRDDIDMTRSEVRLFREATSALSGYLPFASSPQSLPGAETLAQALSPVIDAYGKIEDRFAAELGNVPDDLRTDPVVLAARVRATANATGINIRFFVEERDRYLDHEYLVFNDLYVPQALNFAREVLAQRGQSTDAYDDALAHYGGPGETVLREEASYRIRADQFKSSALRALEYLVSIPCRYNADRTNVFNTQLRRDPHYSATMALLFHAIRELTLELRARSNAHQKAADPVWSIVSVDAAQPQGGSPLREVASSRELPVLSAGVEWVVLPSTPTTHYPLGLKLSHGLTDTFHHFLDRVVRDVSLLEPGQPTRDTPLRVIGIAHTGRQSDGETIVEASMLYNRFALNADQTGTFHGHPARLIYERLLLPRLVDRPRELLYAESQLAVRDENGVPLYSDGTRARRIAREAIGRLTSLKLLAHSSGISTAQQLDMLIRLDSERLGYAPDELRAIFDRALVISFASASNVLVDWAGTSVVDVTAFNDVRSLAGTTTDDYLFSEGAPLDTLRRALLSARAGDTPVGGYRYEQAKLLRLTGAQGKTVARLTGVFLMDDVARQHDGHSIRRYLEGTPRWLRQWLSAVFHAHALSGALDVLGELEAAAGERLANKKRQPAAPSFIA
ncbi:3-keto-5-aminohexanoate cleavage protein [Paraburkholderia caledonica]|uniref:Uncharacterized protein (DUF849 family) n=1 Tax=Paraburkholderia caledonica TaxID=134536 RepID=A0AB73IQG7_9BURK|nr:uncharacterized protein (DUF849 family) [Paraburkholderia caledonica]